LNRSSDTVTACIRIHQVAGFFRSRDALDASTLYRNRAIRQYRLEQLSPDARKAWHRHSAEEIPEVPPYSVLGSDIPS
jgi:hypothetical protein